MKLTKLILKNFRGYRHEVVIDFGNITTFVGKNDCGKSTILEALDIFFNDNKNVVKIDKDDINVDGQREGDFEILIGACFKDLPKTVIIDASNKTSLSKEYLLNSHCELEVIKKYPNAGKAKVYIKAYHPGNVSCNNLLELKNSELKNVIQRLGIEDVDKTKNAEMRAAIWKLYHNDLRMEEQLIDVSKGDTSKIWDNLTKYLPTYSLFQSDRENSDKDDEVQDPLRYAVKELMRQQDIQDELTRISEQVIQKLNQVAKSTLEKLKEMDPDVAKTLSPSIPAVKDLKWADVFKNVAISGDDGIALNKRGSGVRRLILLNFFRAESERKIMEQKEKNDSVEVIYAIEEPETSQHFKNQVVLAQSLKELASHSNVQVILTTHSGIVLKMFSFDELRLVNNGQVEPISANCLPYPSLNEINYIAFGQNTTEYHDELYAILSSKDELLKQFEEVQHKVKYIRVKKSGSPVVEYISLSKKIRHQIHHPENKSNEMYTSEELANSILVMRKFIFDHYKDFFDDTEIEVG